MAAASSDERESSDGDFYKPIRTSESLKRQRQIARSLPYGILNATQSNSTDAKTFLRLRRMEILLRTSYQWRIYDERLGRYTAPHLDPFSFFQLVILYDYINVFFFIYHFICMQLPNKVMGRLASTILVISLSQRILKYATVSYFD